MDMLQLNKQLTNAVSGHDYDLVNSLLREGADPTITVNEDDGNLLHHVIDSRIASLLIREGVNIEGRNRDRLTPLFLAVRRNNTGLATVLLRNGASISDDNLRFNHSLLHISIESGNYDITELLLDHGGRLNEYANDNLETPLHIALRLADVNINIVDLLLERGADLKLKSGKGVYPFHTALKNRYCPCSVIEKLINKGGNVAYMDEDLNTAFNLAVYSGCEEKVNFILKLGGDILAFNLSGNNPLHLAICTHGKANIIKLLLMHSYTVNVFHLNDTEHIARHVVKSSAKKYVNIKNKEGLTPLDLALYHIQTIEIDTINELLRHGANILAVCRNKNFFSLMLRVLKTGRLGIPNISHHCALHKICFYETEYSKELMKDVIKLFVKYGLLTPNFNLEEFKFKSTLTSIHNYINECQSELSVIKQELNVPSLCEMVFYEGNKTPLPSSTIHKILRSIENENNFTSILMFNLERCDVLRSFLKEGMYTISKETKHKIYLNSDIIASISKYLEDKDLIHLIAAFLVNVEEISVTQDRVLTNNFLQHLDCPVKNFHITLNPIQSDTDLDTQQLSEELHESVKNPDCQVSDIERLINLGAKVNYLDENKYSALHRAVEKFAKYEIVECLLKHHTNMNAYNALHNNPLHIALGDPNIRPDVLKLLLNYSSGINIFNSNYLGPKVPDNIAKSFQSGLYINICNNEGMTPLHLAMLHPYEVFQVKIIEELLSNGADALFLNSSGKSPLICAFEVRENDKDGSENITNIIKLMIKYSIYKPNFEKNISLCNLQQNSFASKYISLCQAELFLLEKELIDNTLLGVRLECECSKKCVLYRKVKRILEIRSNNEYPIYKDLLVKKVGRKDILNWVGKQKVWESSDFFSNTNHFCFHAILSDQIGKYLSYNDAFNLAMACANKAKPDESSKSLKRSKSSENAFVKKIAIIS